MYIPLLSHKYIVYSLYLKIKTNYCFLKKTEKKTPVIFIKQKITDVFVIGGTQQGSY